MIKLAKTAGFCFGVDRAVKTVYSLVEEGKRVCTLGPIIHNPQVVKDLEEKGVRIINKPCEAEKDETVVIRSHGVSDAVLAELEDLGLSYVDATCPFVNNIHKLVREAGDSIVIVAGDPKHPEVEGITGCRKGECYVIKNDDELAKLLEENSNFDGKRVIMCSQTTFNVKMWEKCSKIIKKGCTNLSVFDTICYSTSNRQMEADSLSRESDVMLIVGGRESSNTAKLRDVCMKNARSYLIETKDEIFSLPEDWNKINCLGITAGASTPASIIKEVFDTMSELFENENFEAMLEESFKNFNTDGKVRGVVVSMTPTEVYVDVGRKQAGYIPYDELSSDPNVKPEDVCKVGDELELLIMKTNDAEGTIMLSKKRVDAQRGWDDLAEAEAAQEVLTAKVTEVVKGGVIIAYNGVRVFVPASQATENRGDDLTALKGEEVSFRIIEVNKQRRRAVGSIRSVLVESKKEAEEKFWAEVEEGMSFTGKVKSITSFGAFVDLGGVDGMIHISELSWNRIKHPSEVVSVGDEVTVFIKSLDKEAKRISLGYKKDEDNPWYILENQYPVGTVCEATIVSTTQFGAFARIIPGIDGLIHISQIANERVAVEKIKDFVKVGDTVNVKITEIDFDKKRVSLSMKALLTAEEPAEVEETEAE